LTSKKQLLQKIRRETRPQKGFNQWIFVLERRRLAEDAGLLLGEAQLNGKVEWSGSVSIPLPEKKKFSPTGQELPGEWDDIAPGKSKFNVFTFEMRGKTVADTIKGFFKRSLEEGKLQDLLPW
jgi:hypothetical protein